MQTAQCLSATQFLGYISRQVCNIFCLFLQVFNETPSYSLSRNVSLLSRRERFWQQFSDTLTHARSLEAINAVDKQKGPKASSRSTCPFEIPVRRAAHDMSAQVNKYERSDWNGTNLKFEAAVYQFMIEWNLSCRVTINSAMLKYLRQGFVSYFSPKIAIQLLPNENLYVCCFRASHSIQISRETCWFSYNFLFFLKKI